MAAAAAAGGRGDDDAGVDNVGGVGAVAVAVVGGIGVEDGGGVDTVVAVVVVVVETRGQRGVSDVGGAGSSEGEVEGVLLVFERKALRLVGAFGAVLKNGRKVVGWASRGGVRADGLHESKGGVDVEGWEAGLVGVAVGTVVDVGGAGRVVAVGATVVIVARCAV